ncbi:MAG: glycerophosphodiester phosphodiesterase [Oscillospiraceae bacterium]|jgi:glycerophosphoryl diester phosphodiesterase|nr:glycerophosphodiester phosphodiesterase [Oscillospiraceae bacterium]
MPKPTITAHAGALGTKDNTLESALACAACPGVDRIEVDVRFLPDGTPVLLHNAGAPATCVRLEDLLRQVDCNYNLDMKETTHMQRIASLAQSYRLTERAVLTGLAAKDIFAVQSCGVPYYLNCAPTRLRAKTCVAQAKALGCVGLNIHFRACGKHLVQLAHAHGLLVQVWTVNGKKHLRRMRRMGVDGITSRRPDLVREVLHAP